MVADVEVSGPEFVVSSFYQNLSRSVQIITGIVRSVLFEDDEIFNPKVRPTFITNQTFKCLFKEKEIHYSYFLFPLFLHVL